MRLRRLQLGHVAHIALCRAAAPDAVDWETPVNVMPYVRSLARATGMSATQGPSGVVLRDRNGRRVRPGDLAP
jgi:hypothetical protein